LAGMCAGVGGWPGAALWCLAVAGTGSAVGFLFGIPKVRRGETDNGESGYGQRVNTNLEDISDWLTKIIVGVTLVQFRDAVHAFDALAGRMATDLDLKGGATTSGALIVYFAVIGFFYGYLMTRLFLAAAFRRADLTAIGEEVSQLHREVKDLRASVQPGRDDKG
jgi:hypothetical protein